MERQTSAHRRVRVSPSVAQGRHVVSHHLAPPLIEPDVRIYRIRLSEAVLRFAS